LVVADAPFANWKLSSSGTVEMYCFVLQPSCSACCLSLKYLLVLRNNVYIWLQLLKGWKNKLDLSDAPLPQDLYEGVDPDEWVCFTTRCSVQQ